MEEKIKEYCKCNYRKTKNLIGIIFIENNKGYCEKCEKPIHHRKMIRLISGR